MKETDELKTELNRFIENVFINRVAAGAIAAIRARTLKGKFAQGGSQYSTKPFAMPIGGLTKQLRARILQESKKDPGKNSATRPIQLFKAKSGNLWVIVQGGYRKLRELAGKDAANVSLSWTGRMLSDLARLKGKDKHSAEIGFKSKEQQQKAIYHNIMGAGKSKKKHVFMYLTKDELDKIAEQALN